MGKFANPRVAIKYICIYSPDGTLKHRYELNEKGRPVNSLTSQNFHTPASKPIISEPPQPAIASQSMLASSKPISFEDELMKIENFEIPQKEETILPYDNQIPEFFSELSFSDPLGLEIEAEFSNLFSEFT
ncbi:hypothetical protein GPJ56_009704 [Histomonas meleagridis]|uniref:uncharacterized protein n=1 Tax=Histomonas meleagridis TaxID=135588 RepID=UPI00355A2C6F|nr:hypothetical protein GPJ56_009704 [Histomonas meleagridis]KAH0802266.1 hypothetical protein GO595_004879 [Histomonas meleagridis]